MIDLQIKDLATGGVTPRFLLLMPRAIDTLILEVAGMTAEHALDRTRADGSIVYRGLEVVCAPWLARFTPVHVVGSVAEELDVYHLHLKRSSDAPVQPA